MRRCRRSVYYHEIVMIRCCDCFQIPLQPLFSALAAPISSRYSSRSPGMRSKFSLICHGFIACKGSFAGGLLGVTALMIGGGESSKMSVIVGNPASRFLTYSSPETRHWVALNCGSKSTSNTRQSSRLTNTSARLVANVVLATPPFIFTILTTGIFSLLGSKLTRPNLRFLTA